jgi:hypothetical protein
MSKFHHHSESFGASGNGLGTNRRLPPRIESSNSGCTWQVHLFNCIDTKTRTTQGVLVSRVM